jgi:hypothetical protein
MDANDVGQHSRRRGRRGHHSWRHRTPVNCVGFNSEQKLAEVTPETSTRSIG